MAFVVECANTMMSIGFDQDGTPRPTVFNDYTVDVSGAEGDDRVVLRAGIDPATGEQVVLRFELERHPEYGPCLRLDIENSSQMVSSALEDALKSALETAELADFTIRFGMSGEPEGDIVHIATPAVLVASANDRGFSIGLPPDPSAIVEAGSVTD